MFPTILFFIFATVLVGAALGVILARNPVHSALLLVLALCTPASADCLPASQDAVTAVQILDAYSISRYTWAGDPWYDQVMPWCAHTAVREFSCAAAVNVGIRLGEDAALRTAPPAKRRAVCILNVAGAIAYGVYIRHAIEVQILSIKF